MLSLSFSAKGLYNAVFATLEKPVSRSEIKPINCAIDVTVPFTTEPKLSSKSFGTTKPQIAVTS